MAELVKAFIMAARLDECSFLVDVTRPPRPIILFTDRGQAIVTRVSSFFRTFRMFSLPQILMVGFPSMCVLYTCPYFSRRCL